MKLKRCLLIPLLLIIGCLNIKAQITQIPCTFQGKHLFIKVQTKQGDSLNFIFDTGATGASIDSATAERVGISKENRQNVSIAGSGGSQFYTMAVNQNLKVGSAELNNINLVLVNLSSLSAAVGSRIDGIIGYEILNNYVTQLDFDHKKLLLYDKIQTADTSGYTGIPFQFNKDVLIPRFPISIKLANGESFTGRAMFDTGNAFSLIVSTPFSKYHDFKSKIGETTQVQGRGMNAFTQDQIATIQSMSFNNFKFDQMAIRLTINDQAEPKDGYLGILGIEVIKHFNVILDYANKRIYLKPNKLYSTGFNMEGAKGKWAEESKAFLEKNKNKPGIKVTPTGLQYKVIKMGKGPKPTMEDKGKVSLHYAATLYNGQKLWSTYDDGKPWEHNMDKTFTGLREAALMMPAGSKWIIYMPASVAFGDSGFDRVPAGAAIIYELEVLEVNK